MIKSITLICLLFLAACSLQPGSAAIEKTILTDTQEVSSVDTVVAQINTTMTADAKGTEQVLAQTTTPQPSPTSSICTLNQPCQATGVEVMVTAVSTTTEIGESWKAQPGDTYLVIDVAIKNLERDQLPYNVAWFTLTDAQGTTLIANSFAPMPELKNGILTHGDEVNGRVTFQISELANGFVVTYLPLDMRGGYLPIQIDLGQ